MIKLPLQLPISSVYPRGWLQTNRGDSYGSLVGSWNIDLNTNIGKIRSTRMAQTTSQAATYGATINADMTDYPVGFKSFNDGGTIKIFTVAGTKVHTTGNALPYSSFDVDATSGTPTTCHSSESDIEVFNGSLYVTTYDAGGDKLYKKTAGGNWAANATGLGTQTGPHMMTTYASRLYISRGNGRIYSMDTTDTIATSGSNTLALDTQYNVTFLRASSNRIWIGTVNQTGKGYIYEWNGAAQEATRAYRLESNGALACVIKDDLPWVVDTNGKLLAYENGTFKEKARLPLKHKYLGFNSPFNTANNRFIHPNGMTLFDGRVNFLIGGVALDNTASSLEFAPSGVWEYDDITQGLYHKYSLSYTPVLSTTVYDYGQNRIYIPGGLSEMRHASTSVSATGNIIAGAVIYTNATTTDAGVFVNDTLEAGTAGVQKAMYIVTSKFESSQIQDMWNRVLVRHKPLISAADDISVKWRLTLPDPVEITITWVNNSSFTTSTNISAYEGYEVEILQGTGGGRCAHIDDVTESGGVYTATLDETYSNVTGTAKARLQNWTKIPLEIDQTLHIHEFPIGEASEEIQLKVCCLFKDRDELDEIIMVNTTYQPAI